MIDTSKKYWTGDSTDDITQWLRLYAEDDKMDVKPVICHCCGNDRFKLKIDRNENAVQVKCTECGTEKILLDCGEVWEDAKPKLLKCSVCKICKSFNVQIGLLRRENGSVKWVYVGNRCTRCGTLSSYLDWEINYEPTDECEQNI